MCYGRVETVSSCWWLVMEDNAQISYRNNRSIGQRSSTEQAGNRQDSGPGVAEVITASSKKLKDKIKNFFYERKGYKRVNTTNATAGFSYSCGFMCRRWGRVRWYWKILVCVCFVIIRRRNVFAIWNVYHIWTHFLLFIRVDPYERSHFPSLTCVEGVLKTLLNRTNC